jgi:hypothetical protein
MGWLSYVVLIHTEYVEQPDFMAIAMVTAFLVGFSSKLVISIINQVITIVERGLNLDRHNRPPTARSSET